MIDRLAYLGWVLLGAFTASGVSLGLGWLVGAFWVGFLITLIVGIVAYLFGDRLVRYLLDSGHLARARARLPHRAGRDEARQGRHRKP